MVKDYGEILLESMSTLLNASLQALAKPASETEEEKKAREEKLLTTTDPFTNFFPNYTKTIVPTAGAVEGTLSGFWPISINSKKNNLLAVECVISTARIPETEETDEPEAAVNEGEGSEIEEETTEEPETEEEVQRVSIPGDFGIMIGVQCENKTKVYHFTSNDMFGNIYNFKQMPQKIILNLPEDVDMKSIGFTAYNNDTGLTFTLNSITLSLGEDLNVLGPILEPFEISCVEANPKVIIGEDENGDLISPTDTDYHLEARYVGKNAHGNYYVVSPNNTTNWPIGLTVRWYKFKAGAAASDVWGGAEWEYLTSRDGLALTCPISELLDEEPDSYKAVLIGFDDTIGKQVNLVSNIVSIDKESLPTEGPITKIGIEFQDGTKGNYPYYDLDNYICPSLMHQTVVKRNAVCKINTPYIDEENGTILPAFFNKINYIEWIYDSKAIQQVDIAESTTFGYESYFDANGYSHCRFKDFNNINNTIFDSLCSFTYLIPQRLSINDIEDKLICKFVFKDGREYEASRTLTFTQRGNNGTDYTVIARLFNEVNQVVNVVPIGTEGNFYISVDVYDPEGKRLESINPAAITIENTTYVQANQKWQLNNAASANPMVCEIQIRFGSGNDTNKEVPERIIYLKDYLFIPKCAPAYGDRIYKGPTKIVYNSEGVHPEYNNSFLELLSTSNTASVSWRLNSSIITPVNTTDFDFTSLNPEITLSAGKYSFTPVGTFDARLESSVMSLEASDDSGIVWKQPIKFIQNKHFSSIIDGWDGSLQIDEDGNYIMASAYVAGGKNDKNEFTGLVMGQLGTITETKEAVATVAQGETAEVAKPNYKNSHETTPIAKETGLFGYREGAQSFGFRSDGTAFIGPSGGGRINFDGNGGVIYSGNFDGFTTVTNEEGETVRDEYGNPLVQVTEGSQGTYLDLQNGTLIATNGTFRGELNTESGTLAGWKLDAQGLHRSRASADSNASIASNDDMINQINEEIAQQGHWCGINSETFVAMNETTDLPFDFDTNSTMYYVKITGTNSDATINKSIWTVPKYINMVPVQELINDESDGNAEVTTVQIDKNVNGLTIGPGFFKNYSALQKVYIPKGVSKIGQGAFPIRGAEENKLIIYLEGEVGLNWAPGWQGNAIVYYNKVSEFADKEFDDIKTYTTLDNPYGSELVRFYAGGSKAAPSMDEWVSATQNNTSVFLVSDTGKAYMTDVVVKNLSFYEGSKLAVEKITAYNNDLDLDIKSRLDIVSGGSLTVSGGQGIQLKGYRGKDISLSTYTSMPSGRPNPDNWVEPANKGDVNITSQNLNLYIADKITFPHSCSWSAINSINLTSAAQYTDNGSYFYYKADGSVNPNRNKITLTVQGGYYDTSNQPQRTSVSLELDYYKLQKLKDLLES